MDFKQFVSTSVESNARFIHIVSGTVPVMQFRDRVQKFEVERLTPPMVYQIVDSFITDESKQKLLQDSEVFFRYQYDNEVSLRVHVYKQRGTLALSAKLIQDKLFSLKELSFPDVIRDSFLRKKSGLILFGGPSDSGKTTLLNAFIDYVATQHSWHIITMDDVQEISFSNYENSLISRRVYGAEVPDLETYMESLLKEDFNAISLGALDSAERFCAAVNLASRGGLVFGTMLSNDVEAIFKKLFSSSYFTESVKNAFADNLIGIYHQKFFSNFRGEYFPVNEAITNNSVVKKHLRESNLYALLNYMKSTTHEDCFSYRQSFEELVKLTKIDEDEVPRKYKSS
jgi:Tfp pilus assembly pilus retraction ATPase PilT